MSYLVWYDESPTKTAKARIQDAVSAYVKRFTHRPLLVLVNAGDQQGVDGVEVRNDNMVQPNNVWVRLEDDD
jgi:hypothetical protein